MKKIHLILQEKDLISGLKSLRDMGVLHVEHLKTPKSPRIKELKEHIQLLGKVISVLSLAPKVKRQVSFNDWQEKACEIVGLGNIIDNYKEGVSRRQLQIHQWELWGDFDPKDIEELAARDVFIKCLEIPEKEMETFEWPEGVILEVVFKKDGIARCVTISQKDMDVGRATLDLPEFSLKEIREEQEIERGKIKEAEEQIKLDAKYLDYFQGVLLKMQEELAFQEVYAGKGDEDVLTVLKGFCPKDCCDDLKSQAKKEQWAILVEDPSDEDQVPTLIKNSKWVNLIKPVFSFINIFPGYRELDISIAFLVFFSIFVGMIVGDAGYGLLFVLMTAGYHFKYGKNMKDKSVLYLIYLLSSTSILWGMLTATFFGQQWLPESMAKPLVPWLTDINNIQSFCFTLGAVHLSLAHIWRMILKWPTITFLADVGWLLLLWVMYFLAKYLILGTMAFPLTILGVLAGISVVLVLLFSVVKSNIFKSIGQTLIDLSFGLAFINAFTDVVSYIRLFAVGLAAVAVADAANQMASQVPLLGGIIILLIGHSLNIILSLLAILVHGLRLNILEFSGHLSLEWAGLSFSPFRKLLKT